LKKILLIEDDVVLSKNITDSLTEKQMLVEAVYDGILATKLLIQNNYDCIILDISLPGKNGYEVCKDFRKFNKITPVIMLTAFNELEDKVQGFECGSDDYLTKPFYMKELVMRIYSLTRRNNGGSLEVNKNTLLIFGDIIINQHSKTVTRQGIGITLTPREYQIFLRLILSKDEIVSKNDLIKEIWGKALDVNTNTIEVYINFLRKKIDKPFGKENIKTKIGYGYYFEDVE
jgi:DNA-binding response OmpR family regulator